MSAAPFPVLRHASFRAHARGVALVLTLLLLLVLTILGTTGLVTAVLELRMAANTQYQERAFAAAEFAIEQALRAPGLSTALTLSHPLLVPDTGSAPGVPGSSSDSYTYRLYFDCEADPPTGTVASNGAIALKAYHFVIEATGSSLRGAKDTHIQGFYVLAPDPAPATLTPPACAPGCGDPTAYGPKRTFWLQTGAD